MPARSFGPVVWACIALMLPLARANAQQAPGADFDQTYRALYGPNSYDRSPVYYRQLVAKLRDELPPHDAARALRLFAAECTEPQWWRQPVETRAAQVKQALARAHRNDPVAEVHLLTCQAWQHNSEGRDSLALKDTARAVEAGRHSGEPIVLGDALTLHAIFQSSLGDQPSALISYAEAARLLGEAGVSPLPRDLMIARARAYRRLGDLRQARLHLQEYDHSLGNTPQDTHALFASLLERSFIELDDQRPAQAKANAQHALELLPATEPLRRGNALLARARANVELGLYRQALDDIAQIPLSDGSPVDRGLEALMRARAQQGLGQYAAALTELQVAESLLRRDANPRYLSWLYEARADAHAAVGDHETALADFREHIRLRDQITASMAGQQELLRDMEHAILNRAAENRSLRNEKAALEQVRRWQAGAIASGSLLILLLGYTLLVQMQRSRRLRRLADFDALTHVASRASILSDGDNAVAQAHAESSPMCVLMLDIDHFKAVNDTHGHPFGDEVLAEVAKACRKSLRPRDLLGRTGGEEFLVICPDTALADGRSVAERILLTVQALASRPALAALGSLTVSIGLAQLGEGEDLQALVRRADRALYRAKRSGRNRVEAAD